eukprot:m.7949 g.7949  ORF g.7949 m.7949 type:complete len:374 (+) comp5987_c0_seq1:685-1806(+)
MYSKAVQLYHLNKDKIGSTVSTIYVICVNQCLPFVKAVQRSCWGRCAGISMSYWADIAGGTFGVESVIGTMVPRTHGKVLVLSNGAYGKRMAQMCSVLGIDYTELAVDETEVPSAEAAVAAIRADDTITHVTVVHHETTAGTINPVQDIGKAVKEANPSICYVVDSMSGFGCLPIDLEAAQVDYLVSSANKCIEGVPGFAYAIARRSHLEQTSGWARSLSLDLHAQWKGLEGNGQFRFTPPTHAILAFHTAMLEHAAEGGVPGRLDRYEANAKVLHEGMAAMGFHPLLPSDIQGPIITSYLWPDDPSFDFSAFYHGLADRGFVIYPGKTTKADCFRIGSIGRLFDTDMENLVSVIRDVLTNMGVTLPVTQIKP